MRALKLTVAGIGLLVSGAAFAGPFCLMVQGMPASCRYFDEASCQRAAIEHNGGCVANNAFATTTGLANAPKDARFCLVTGGDSKCNYYDAKSCAKAAQENGGTCLTRPSKTSP